MPLKGWLQFCHLPEGPEGSLNWPILSLLKSESRLPIFRGGKKKCGTCFLSLLSHSAADGPRHLLPGDQIYRASSLPGAVLSPFYRRGNRTEARNHLGMSPTNKVVRGFSSVPAPFDFKFSPSDQARETLANFFFFFGKMGFLK